MPAYILVDITINDPQAYERHAAAKALRQSCTTTGMLLVEGFPGG
jgi:uncharacterized protein (DUF1330 family)